MAPDGAPITLTASGQAGDRWFVVVAKWHGFQFAPPSIGPWLVPVPVLQAAHPLGILPAPGQANLQVFLGSLGAGPHGRAWIQGIALDSQSTVYQSSPADLLVLNRNADPDCNGNGTSDWVELALGTPDCNRNLVPDGCEIAAGTEQDCNGNSVPDSCDIKSGLSLDLNGNGIPDECESGVTWFVDASAPAGGNGSSASPFQKIGQGLAVAVGGDTVIVRDGIYKGPGNRGLTFGGRDLALVSANGPANCIIDCELQGRAFDFTSGEGPDARIEGFTVLRGAGHDDHGGAIYIFESDPTIENCVFESCLSQKLGGALFLHRSDSVIRDCIFRNCSAIAPGTPTSSGGAVYISTGARCRFEYCLFEGNTADFGGAVMIFGNHPVTTAAPRVSHCRFIENSADSAGGAVYLHPPNSWDSSHVEQSLFAGNTAPWGGALYAQSGMGVVRNSTFVGNAASIQGGAAYFWNGLVTNSIIWDNQAPMGTQVGGSVEVRYSTVQSPPVVVGPGTITLDPLFVDPDGPDNDPATFGDNDYRLLPNSPCIDASDNLAMLPDFWDLDGDGNFTEPMPFDLVRAGRFRDVPTVPDTGNGAPPIADMGVFEHRP